jgi:hypothetical protein
MATLERMSNEKKSDKAGLNNAMQSTEAIR